MTILILFLSDPQRNSIPELWTRQGSFSAGMLERPRIFFLPNNDIDPSRGISSRWQIHSNLGRSAPISVHRIFAARAGKHVRDHTSRTLHCIEIGFHLLQRQVAQEITQNPQPSPQFWTSST